MKKKFNVQNKMGNGKRKNKMLETGNWMGEGKSTANCLLPTAYLPIANFNSSTVFGIAIISLVFALIRTMIGVAKT